MHKNQPINPPTKAKPLIFVEYIYIYLFISLYKYIYIYFYLFIYTQINISVYCSYPNWIAYPSFLLRLHFFVKRQVTLHIYLYEISTQEVLVESEESGLYCCNLRRVFGGKRGGDGSRGGGNRGTLRIPREDWGTLGNIREY